jgi:hypothetical protein
MALQFQVGHITKVQYGGLIYLLGHQDGIKK